jgi:hypothetical protein
VGSRQKSVEAGTVGKRVVFDRDSYNALDLLARDRMMTFQELADEAFRDLLKKHNRPSDFRSALKQSARELDKEGPGRAKRH